jgi:hypothetical protein
MHLAATWRFGYEISRCVSAAVGAAVLRCCCSRCCCSRCCSMWHLQCGVGNRYHGGRRSLVLQDGLRARHKQAAVAVHRGVLLHTDSIQQWAGPAGCGICIMQSSGISCAIQRLSDTASCLASC